MTKLPEKTIPISELKQQLLNELAHLASANRALKHGHGPKMEWLPVAKGIENIVGIIRKLQARGEKISIPIKLDALSPDMRTMLELNPTVGKFFEQAALKEELLKKHGHEKLKQYRTRKRKLPSPRLPKKKPF